MNDNIPISENRLIFLSLQTDKSPLRIMLSLLFGKSAAALGCKFDLIPRESATADEIAAADQRSAKLFSFTASAEPSRQNPFHVQPGESIASIERRLNKAGLGERSLY